ncbi:hypothetical protein Hamer_G025181, partial [Homarus americanus]
CGGLQPRVTSTIPEVWRLTTTCYLHNSNSVAAYNHVSPPQYQKCGGLQPLWRPTTTCYLHNTSSVAAYNHVLPPQYQQCGGLQPCVASTIPT